MSTPKISIVDYQAGNVRSVQKALERFGVAARVTGDSAAITDSDGIVFPGQGASDASMRHMRARGLVEPIKEFVASGRPFLGVCLGLQLLLEDSEEGVEPCLGILPGRVRRLPPGQKIPHMGWNEVEIHYSHPLFEGIRNRSHFYFVHSYYADPVDKEIVVGTTDYGIEFCSAVAWGNVAAIQFHPEKSGATGLRIYENFLKMVSAVS